MTAGANVGAWPGLLGRTSAREAGAPGPGPPRRVRVPDQALRVEEPRGSLCTSAAPGPRRDMPACAWVGGREARRVLQGCHAGLSRGKEGRASPPAHPLGARRLHHPRIRTVAVMRVVGGTGRVRVLTVILGPAVFPGFTPCHWAVPRGGLQRPDSPTDADWSKTELCSGFCGGRRSNGGGERSGVIVSHRTLAGRPHSA